MMFHRPNADSFVPDGLGLGAALARTTHLAVGAHQDDLEIMACDGILACFQDPEQWFTGVVVTDGQNSPRTGPYQQHNAEAMGRVRRVEQRAAAVLGRFGAMIQLDYPSAAIKEGCSEAVEDLAQLFRATRPETIYTHNLADKHDTHVAVTLRVLEALRKLDPDERPARVYGCEVWRDLDWLCTEDKVALEVSGREALQTGLLGVFDSQVSGGKRYDLAVLGRRRAHATFGESHAVDGADGLCYAMDLTPLMTDDGPGATEYVAAALDRFREDVLGRISRFGG